MTRDKHLDIADEPWSEDEIAVLTSWPAMPAPGDAAERAVVRMHRRRNASRATFAATAAVVALVAAGAWLTWHEDPSVRGELLARETRILELGNALVTAQPGASLRWAENTTGVSVDQSQGGARYEATAPFTVTTPAGWIRVAGTTTQFHVEVVPMNKALGAAAVTLVTVYQGHALAGNQDHNVAVGASETVELRRNHPPLKQSPQAATTPAAGVPGKPSPVRETRPPVRSPATDCERVVLPFAMEETASLSFVLGLIAAEPVDIPEADPTTVASRPRVQIVLGEGVDPLETIPVPEVEGLCLQEALRRVLAPLDYDYVIRGDRLLVFRAGETPPTERPAPDPLKKGEDAGCDRTVSIFGTQLPLSIVLSQVARQQGLTITMRDGVDGDEAVTIPALQSVCLEEALHEILTARGYGFELRDSELIVFRP